jgi:hypothetical protein
MATGLNPKYIEVFEKENITRDNFIQMVESQNGCLIDLVMQKCELKLGDYIKLAHYFALQEAPNRHDSGNSKPQHKI